EVEDRVGVRLGGGVLDHLLALVVRLVRQLDDADLLVGVLGVPRVHLLLQVAGPVLAGHERDRPAALELGRARALRRAAAVPAAGGERERERGADGDGGGGADRGDAPHGVLLRGTGPRAAVVPQLPELGWLERDVSKALQSRKQFAETFCKFVPDM